MKTVFIFNSKAGQGNAAAKLNAEIQNAAEKLGMAVETYRTKARGDAERFAREYCMTNGAARFIACGGDGTVSEVVNGIMGFPGAQAGVIPFGTGNDFCRNFANTKLFANAEEQLKGDTVKCDAIKYVSGNNCGYCINMANIGFDCNVADMTGRLKKKRFLSGSLAYFISIFIMLVNKKGANLKITADGKMLYEGKLLLNSIANGSFCGGGIKSNPLAELNDGKMDINIVRNISRVNFMSKLFFYMNGTHIKLKNIEKWIYSQKCKEMVVTPLDGTMRLCVDGEIFEVGETRFEIVHDAFEFVVPSREL